MKHFIYIGIVALGCIGCGSNGAEKKENKTQTEKDGKKNDDGKKKDGDNGSEKKENEGSAKKENFNFPYNEHVKVIETWEMPAELKEISGICWLEQNKIAAVQDESGVIFIYDLSQQEIEKEIPFGGKGDYEGITVTPKAFYILRADGTVIEVLKANNKVTDYDTPLNVKDDTEGICYDSKNQRLLISLKASKDSLSGIKSIYAFSLTSYKLSASPVYSIDTEDPIFETGSGKKKDTFQPSEIAIHPGTGELYLAGGTNSSLLILSNTAKMNYYTLLDPAEFVQPEGIAISPTGELFVATEGTKDPGKIFRLDLINRQPD